MSDLVERLRRHVKRLSLERRPTPGGFISTAAKAADAIDSLVEALGEFVYLGDDGRWYAYSREEEGLASAKVVEAMEKVGVYDD